MPQQAAQPQARRQIVAYTYHHLQHLLHAGLVRTRGGGPRIHYLLPSPRVGELTCRLRESSKDWTVMRQPAAKHCPSHGRSALPGRRYQR
jgi:hypothetical protein